MKKSLISLFLVLTLGLGMLCACSGGGDTASPPPSESASEPASAAPSESASPSESAPAQPETQTIVDMGGTEVTLPTEIRTIVDTWSAATDNLFNLGAADLLVSAHSAAVSEVSRLVYPEIATLEDYSQATTEELMKLHPDLIICSNNDKAEELRHAGLNAVNLMYSTYADFKKSTLLLGQILGGEYEARAEELGEYVDWVSETLSEDLKEVKDEEKPKVYYLMSSDGSNLYGTCGAGSIMDEWITLAGGKLATAELGRGMGLRDVAAEQILATNPDVVMIDGDNAAELRDRMKADPAWAGVTAVKNNAIYCIPKGCFWWGRLCGDTPLQALWAASVLYPDLVSYDIHEETKNYYRNFKQCDLTDEQVDSLLRTDLLP